RATAGHPGELTGGGTRHHGERAAHVVRGGRNAVFVAHDERALPPLHCALDPLQGERRAVAVVTGLGVVEQSVGDRRALDEPGVLVRGVGMSDSWRAL